MFKKHLHLFVIFAWLALASLPFQNCGRQGDGFKSAEETMQHSLSSFDQEFTEGHGEVETATEEGTNYEPILADRYYIQSLLTDIFGPSTNAADQGNAELNATIHGGPCSLYADHGVYNATGKTMERSSAMETCSVSSPNLLIAEVNPKASVTRQALLTRTCSDLTTNNTTLGYALKRISSAAVPEATEENVRTLYDLFYRAQPEPHQGLIDSLLVMLPETPTVNDWRVVVYTVCASSYWQVL